MPEDPDSHRPLFGASVLQRRCNRGTDPDAASVPTSLGLRQCSERVRAAYPGARRRPADTSGSRVRGEDRDRGCCRSRQDCRSNAPARHLRKVVSTASGSSAAGDDPAHDPALIGLPELAPRPAAVARPCRRRGPGSARLPGPGPLRRGFLRCCRTARLGRAGGERRQDDHHQDDRHQGCRRHGPAYEMTRAHVRCLIRPMRRPQTSIVDRASAQPGGCPRSSLSRDIAGQGEQPYGLRPMRHRSASKTPFPRNRTVLRTARNLASSDEFC